ncbi:MAG: hypothetical protein MZW92_03735 [Comamonadaceae bacterium]|nr:hypothetical protein [Comamonadaceae bacterium]
MLGALRQHGPAGAPRDDRRRRQGRPAAGARRSHAEYQVKLIEPQPRALRVPGHRSCRPTVLVLQGDCTDEDLLERRERATRWTCSSR